MGDIDEVRSLFVPGRHVCPLKHVQMDQWICVGQTLGLNFFSYLFFRAIMQRPFMVICVRNVWWVRGYVYARERTSCLEVVYPLTDGIHEGLDG